MSYNPFLDKERCKWFTFDREDCPHTPVSTVHIEVNSIDHALRALSRMGVCVCPTCWEAMHVTVGFNRPKPRHAAIVLPQEQVFSPFGSATLRVPVRVPHE